MRMRLLLTPRWLAFTVLVIAVVATCLALGWWQWTAFHAAGGSGQNLGYTVQWPFFGAFAIYVWWRLLRDASASATASTASATSIASATSAVAAQPTAERPAAERPAASTRTATVVVDEDADPELAAYNRYLARLSAQAEGGPQL